MSSAANISLSIRGSSKSSVYVNQYNAESGRWSDAKILEPSFDFNTWFVSSSRDSYRVLQISPVDTSEATLITFINNENKDIQVVFFRTVDNNPQGQIDLSRKNTVVLRPKSRSTRNECRIWTRIWVYVFLKLNDETSSTRIIETERRTEIIKLHVTNLTNNDNNKNRMALAVMEKPLEAWSWQPGKGYVENEIKWRTSIPLPYFDSYSTVEFINSRYQVIMKSEEYSAKLQFKNPNNFAVNIYFQDNNDDQTTKMLTLQPGDKSPIMFVSTALLDSDLTKLATKINVLWTYKGEEKKPDTSNKNPGAVLDVDHRNPRGFDFHPGKNSDFPEHPTPPPSMF